MVTKTKNILGIKIEKISANKYLISFRNPLTGKQMEVIVDKNKMKEYREEAKEYT